MFWDILLKLLFEIENKDTPLKDYEQIYFTWGVVQCWRWKIIHLKHLLSELLFQLAAVLK